MKTKSKIFKDKNKTNLLLIVTASSIVLAFVLYYITKQILFSFISIFACIGIYFLFSTNILEKSKNKETINEGKIYIDFYNNFQLFSSLENDYQAGFNKATTLLPVCKLKEKISEYQDNTLTLEESLVLLSSRNESQLITEVKRSIIASEYYDKNNRITDLIERYSKEIIPKKSNTDFSTLGILLFCCYILITLFLVYVSKK